MTLSRPDAPPGVMAEPPAPPASIPSRPKLRRVQAVINPASGSVGPGADRIVSDLMAAHGCDLTITMLQPGEVPTAVKAAVRADPDLVLVVAGDGTARLAATLCGPAGPLVAPLAGGTLNMLPHAIYGKRPWQAALKDLLETGVERPVSGGRLGRHAFYVAAILGSPALFAPAREAARAGDLQRAWRRANQAMRRAFSGHIHYGLDGAAPEGSAKAMALITPLVSNAMTEEVGLEAAAFGTESARDFVRLVFNGLVSDWRRDPGVVDEVCQSGRIESHHSIPALLDGEIRRLPNSVEFEYVAKAFRALAPPPATAAVAKGEAAA